MNTVAMFATWLLSGEYLPFVPLCTIATALCVLGIVKERGSIKLYHFPLLIGMLIPILCKRFSISVITQLCAITLSNVHNKLQKKHKLPVMIGISVMVSLFSQISNVIPYAIIIIYMKILRSL